MAAITSLLAVLVAVYWIGRQSSQTTTTGNEPRSQDSQLIKQWAELFSVARHPLEPAEIEARLRTLASTPQVVRQRSPIPGSVWDQVDWLIEQAEPRDEHCTVERLGELTRRRASRRMNYQYNLVTFLSFSMKAQYDYCFLLFLRRLEEAERAFQQTDEDGAGVVDHQRLIKLSLLTKGSMPSLAVESAWRGRLTEQWAVRGAIKLLELEDHTPFRDARLLGPNARPHFRETFQRKVQLVCQKFQQLMGGQVRDLAHLVLHFDETKSDQLDLWARDWLTTSHICAHLTPQNEWQREQVADDAFWVFFWQNYWKYLLYRLVKLRELVLQPDVDAL